MNIKAVLVKLEDLVEAQVKKKNPKQSIKKKNFGAKKVRGIPSTDNPYSSTGTTQLSITKSGAKKLIKFMDSQNDFSKQPAYRYSKTAKKEVGNEYTKDGTKIRVDLDPGTIGNKPVVTIYGPKKAKRMTVPYYD